MFHFSFSIFNNCADTKCHCKRYIIFAMFRVIRRKNNAPMSIGWFVIRSIQILSLLHLIKMSRKGMASLFYSMVNRIDGFIEFKMRNKSLGLILFFSNRVSQSSRKRLQLSKITFPKPSQIYLCKDRKT